jgi:hypothetical protein
MKKIMALAMVIIATMAFTMDITRNRVMGMVGLGYGMTEVADLPVNTMGLSVPDINYQFEAKPSDMFKLYLYGELGYFMSSVTVDGEDAEGFGGSTLLLGLNPMGKLYLPNSLFAKVALPFEYSSYTSDADGAEAWPVQDMNAVVSFGYDTREIYVHGLTPYDLFEKGIVAYAFYDMGLMHSEDGEAAEELESYFGIYGAYAHYADAMMIKPYVQYKMGMNDKVDEDSYMSIGLDFVKDLNEQMNIQANLDFNMHMLADAPEGMEDSYNDIYVDAMFSYYVMPELAIGVGAGYAQDLTTEDANGVTMIMVGAEYTLNLLK